ncbi:serine-rich adhesin for platelets-like isoform X10 [Ambystoma mexicanum]|uniref:serine-rich adhesin for platelets-like isoform X10 n=1 Tax=Ambystoma mexicanum TaxID=8296 RepID=UPI0037E85BC3
MLLVILLFDLLQVLNALVGPEIVIFEPGQSVNITCRYTSTPVNVHDRKFWCKISETTHGCSTVISSNMFVAGGYTNRTWLVDTPVDALFQVQMTELTQKDAGIYRCGIGLSNNGLFVSVFLAISEGPNVTNKLEKVSGRLHGSISVQCTFHESDSNKRFWCKMERTGGCRILVDTGNFINKRYMGRLLIVPGDSLGVVKILFNQLTPEDAGWYRCGSGTFGKGGKWKDVQVLVSTDTGLQGRTSILHGVPGGSAAIECHHDPLINYEHKHWCKSSGTDCLLLVDDAGFVSDAYKGRISLKTGGQSNGTFTFLLTDLRDTDRGWYWCVATDGVYEVTSTVELQIDKGLDSSIHGSGVPKISTFTPPQHAGDGTGSPLFTPIKEVTATKGITERSDSSTHGSDVALYSASTVPDRARDGTGSPFLVATARIITTNRITKRSDSSTSGSVEPANAAFTLLSHVTDGTGSPFFMPTELITTTKGIRERLDLSTHGSVVALNSASTLRHRSKDGTGSPFFMSTEQITITNQITERSDSLTPGSVEPVNAAFTLLDHVIDGTGSPFYMPTEVITTTKGIRERLDLSIPGSDVALNSASTLRDRARDGTGSPFFMPTERITTTNQITERSDSSTPGSVEPVNAAFTLLDHVTDAIGSPFFMPTEVITTTEGVTERLDLSYPGSDVALNSASTLRDRARDGTGSPFFMPTERITTSNQITERSDSSTPGSVVPANAAFTLLDHFTDGIGSPVFRTTEVIITTKGIRERSDTSTPGSDASTSSAFTLLHHAVEGTGSPLFMTIKGGTTSKGVTERLDSLAPGSDLPSHSASTLRNPAREGTGSPSIMPKNGITTTNGNAEKISTLPSAPTDGRASGGVISKAATRARSELPHENSAIPRLSDSPQLQKPAFLLDVTSNNTVLQPGPRRESKRNLLLIVAPSLGVALLLIAVGAFVVIKTRCRKKRVREPINKKTADVALAETKILAPSAEEASPSALGEKETDLDNNDVTKGLMENAVSSSLSTDT